MLTELIGQMQTVMRLTHEVVGDISTRLGALESKVESVDVERKKEVAEVQLVLKDMATSAELVALMKQVVLLEVHMRHVREVLHLTNDEDEE